MDSETRTSLIAELEAAKIEQRRCMGGVDQFGCIAASQRITELRLLLRDNDIQNAHYLNVITNPASPRRSRA